jgi:hypothetical protein
MAVIPFPASDLDPDPAPVFTGKIKSKITSMSRKKNERRDANGSPFTK